MIVGLLSARPSGVSGDKYYATDTQLYYLNTANVWATYTPSDADIRSTGLTRDIQSLSPTALIELFVLDMTNISQGLMYFHAGTNKVSTNIVWNGQSYIPLPIEAEGFAAGSNGTLPRPKIRVANSNGAFSQLIAEHNDLIGCKIVRKRTFMKYLDAFNFIDGTNATANPSQHYPDDIWYVDQKVSETRYIIEWELASAFDLVGVMLPSRQVNQNSCPWVYRGAECGYLGTNYFNSLDTTASQSTDVCGKRLASCEKRFGTTATLPYGGFPGSISSQ